MRVLVPADRELGHSEAPQARAEHAMLLDVLVVGLDRLSILFQPSLAPSPVNLQGESTFQGGGKVDAQLAGLLQKVAVHTELRGLLAGFSIVESFHANSIGESLDSATPKARKTRGGSDRCRKKLSWMKMDGGGGGSRTHVRETRIEGFYVRIPGVLVLAVRVLEQGTPTRRPASRL